MTKSRLAAFAGFALAAVVGVWSALQRDGAMHGDSESVRGGMPSDVPTDLTSSPRLSAQLPSAPVPAALPPGAPGSTTRPMPGDIKRLAAITARDQAPRSDNASRSSSTATWGRSAPAARPPQEARVVAEEEFDTEAPLPADGELPPIRVSGIAGTALEQLAQSSNEKEKIAALNDLAGVPSLPAMMPALLRVLLTEPSPEVRLEALAVASGFEPGESMRQLLVVACAPAQPAEVRIQALNLAATHLPGLIPNYARDTDESVRTEVEFLLADAERSAAERAK